MGFFRGVFFCAAGDVGSDTERGVGVGVAAEFAKTGLEMAKGNEGSEVEAGEEVHSFGAGCGCNWLGGWAIC